MCVTRRGAAAGTRPALAQLLQEGIGGYRADGVWGEAAKEQDGGHDPDGRGQERSGRQKSLRPRGVLLDGGKNKKWNEAGTSGICGARRATGACVRDRALAIRSGLRTTVA